MRLPHIIYGTFPDLPGSQQIVCQSAEIDPVVESRLLTFYNEFGDCKNEEFNSSFAVLWVTTDSGERYATITKVTQQGKDFSGRWGALLRHSAILTAAQYRRFMFDPRDIVAQLVGSGTSAELAASSDLEIEPTAVGSRIAALASLDWSSYRDNLQKLIAGKRLGVYSEINTELTDNYLAELVSLLPVSCRTLLNWSSFLFAAQPEFALSLSHSSRYEAPESLPLQLQELGESQLGSLDYASEYAVEYVEMLETALAENAAGHLEQLVCDLL